MFVSFTITSNLELALLNELKPYNTHEIYNPNEVELKEVTGKGYKRISLKDTEWDPTDNPCRALCNTLLKRGDEWTICKNKEAIKFGEAKEPWGRIKGFALINHSEYEVTFGKTESVPVVKGDTVSFPAGFLEIPIKTW